LVIKKKIKSKQKKDAVPIGAMLRFTLSIEEKNKNTTNPKDSILVAVGKTYGKRTKKSESDRVQYQ
jgi:hypothetical protein